MSYKLFGGVHDILNSVNELKAITSGQREKGQMVAVRDGDYRIYIWDPSATAKELLCALAGEDPATTDFPSKARAWNPSFGPGYSFLERNHMIESAGETEDFGYLFVVPNDIYDRQMDDGYGYMVPVNLEDQPGRWVLMNYASIIDSIPWSFDGGHLIPRYSEEFDIGSASKKVRHHFISDASIWIGEKHRLTIDDSGGLRFQKRKDGKVPYHIESYGSSVDAILAKVLELFPDHSSTITDTSVLPTSLSLQINEWLEVAKGMGIIDNPHPGSIFGDDDFEDAIDLSGLSAADGTDATDGSSGDSSSTGIEDIPGLNTTLGDLSTRVGTLEDKFGSDGVLDSSATPVGPSLQDLVADSVSNTPEWKIPRDFVDPSIVEDLLSRDELLDTDGLLLEEKIAGILNDYTKTVDIPDLPDWPMPIPDWVDTFDATDILSRVGTLDGYFTDGKLNVLNAADGLVNSNQDLSGFLGSDSMLSISNIDGLQGLLDAKQAAGSYLATDSLLNVSNIDGLQGMLDGKQAAGSYITSVSVGDVTGLQDALDNKQAAGSYLSPGDSIDAGNITGVLSTARIPNLSANKITTGQLGTGRIPELAQSKISGLADDLSGKASTSFVNNMDSTLTSLSSDVTSNSTNISTNSSNISHVEGGLVDFAMQAYRVDSWDSYTKLDGSSPGNHTRHFSGTSITDWTEGKVNAGMDYRGLSNTGLSGIVNNLVNNHSSVTSLESNLVGVDTALHSLYRIAVTSESDPITYAGTAYTGGGTMYTDSIRGDNSNIAAAFESNLEPLANSISNVQGSLVSGGILSSAALGLTNSYVTGLGFSVPSAFQYTGTTGVTAVAAALLSGPGGSDKDLKNIIRVVPENEITSDYHLIGLSTVEYKWQQIAADLFGYSGHVAEGFIAEELESLYPAPDPQNPPTSKEDGHIWWHEYVSDEQLSELDNVHKYYTFFNSEMLQAEIDAAKASK